MGKSKPPYNTFPQSSRPSQADIEKSLGELAGHFDDEQTFLNLAKRAWRAKYYWKVPQRGTPSVADKCFQAIYSGYVDLHDGCWLESDDSREFTAEVYERLPLGRLVQMILDRVPSVKRVTARKYARIWERDIQPGTLPTKARMALYRQMKKQRPSLYTGSKSKPRR